MRLALARRVALVTLLVAAGLAGHRIYNSATGWEGYEGFALGLLLFGIVNVLFSTPGTKWVRAIAIGITFVALLWPANLQLVALIAWLVWPPAFMVAWALARESNSTLREPQEDRRTATRARITLAVLIGTVAIASLVYRLLLANGLQQTAALFVGIPALLAILLVFAVSPRSAIGVACKAVTVGLLVSALFLGEGILCVLMSALDRARELFRS